MNSYDVRNTNHNNKQEVLVGGGKEGQGMHRPGLLLAVEDNQGGARGEDGVD